MEIKKCPFCGGEVKCVIAGGFMGDDIAMIVCNDCGMLLSNKYNKRETKKFIIELWNRRVDDEETTHY